MRYHLYVSRPVPPGGGWPATVGTNPTIERDLRDQRDYLFLGTEDTAHLAVQKLLFHAERQTARWTAGGWSDDTPRDELIFELCRARLRTRRPLARITPDGTFRAASTFAELLPGRALDVEVIHYTENHTILNEGAAPTRVPTFTRRLHPGDHLPPVAAQGGTE